MPASIYAWATDWHIRRMGRLLYLSDFLAIGRFLAQGARGVSEGVFAEVCKVGQRVETIPVANLSNPHFRVLQVFEDAFPFLSPASIRRRARRISFGRDGGKWWSCIASQMCKFFDVLRFAVILHDESSGNFPYRC